VNEGTTDIQLTADVPGTNFLELTKLSAGPSLTLAAGASVESSAGVLIPGAMDIKTVENAKASLSALKEAMTQLASDRATIGAYQSRLTYSSEQLAVSQQNLTAASSRIQDTDVAEESTQYARANILLQSGTAMLAQANQVPETVLRLLQ
jgi:flagellin